MVGRIANREFVQCDIAGESTDLARIDHFWAGLLLVVALRVRQTPPRGAGISTAEQGSVTLTVENAIPVDTAAARKREEGDAPLHRRIGTVRSADDRRIEGQRARILELRWIARRVDRNAGVDNERYVGGNGDGVDQKCVVRRIGAERQLDCLMVQAPAQGVGQILGFQIRDSVLFVQSLADKRTKLARPKGRS
jgi:hypothetical protein